MADDIQTPQLPEEPNASTGLPPVVNQQLPPPSTEGPKMVSVLSPDGVAGSIPEHQVQQAINEGYSVDSPEDQAARARHEKFGTPVEMAKTLGEGAGVGLGSALFTKGEIAAGVDPENIKQRREENPITHTAGELSTLVGGSALGVGEGALLGHLGEGAVTVLGMAAPITRLAKIGTAATRLGIENALYQTGSEADKAVLDPTSVESAIPNIGVAGLIGAGTGVLGAGIVSPLWEAAAGPKVGKFLQTFKNRVNGEPTALPEAVDKAAQDSGIELKPTVRAAMSGDPTAMDYFNKERELQTPELINDVKDLHQQASNKSMEALGKTPEEVSNYSEADHGRETIEGFKKEFRSISDPISKEFDEVASPFEESKFQPRTSRSVQTEETLKNPYLNPTYTEVTNPGTSDVIASKLMDLAEKEGYLTPGLPHNDLINTVLKALPDINNVQELTKFTSVFGKTAYANPATKDLGRKVTSLLTEAGHDIVRKSIGEKAPELLERFDAARREYAKLSALTREMSQNLSIGKPGGPKDFLNRLEEKRSPEEFLKKLSPKGNAEMIKTLQDNFPETLKKIRENELFKLAKPSVLAAKGEHPINVKTLNNAVEGMSPEMRQFIFEGKEAASGHTEATLKEAIGHTSNAIEGVREQVQQALKAGDNIGAEKLMGNLTALETSLANNTQSLAKGEFGGVQSGALNKIRGAKLLTESLPEFKSSGTAGWLTKLNKHVMGGATAVASMLMGHNPVVGLALGEAGELLSKKAPSAIRMSMLKFMGSEAPISSGGFKASVDMLHSIYKGDAMISKAAKNMFKPGQQVVDSHLLASAEDREKIDKRLLAVQNNPNPAIDSKNHLEHYLPEHAAAATATASNAVTYLNGLRPATKSPSGMPFDGDRTPSSTEKANYNNALNIAHQPLSVLAKIKEGSITSKDVSHLRTLYPNLYNNMAKKITNEMASCQDQGTLVPYKTRQGLSLFLGEPLNSYLTPQSIIAAQPKPNPSQQPQNQPQAPKKGSMKELDKLPKAYMTPDQAREQRSHRD